MHTLRARLTAAVLLLIAVGVGGWFAMDEEPPPPPETADAADTGMTDAETEELMRAIGYVQQ